MSIRAIMVVHIYGRRVNMDLIHAFAKKHGLLVIEDLAEAHGIKPHPETHAVCHSFYKNKIVAGEEGGAVWFRDPAHATLARKLRSLGFTDAHDFTHIPRGHNYRISNAHAELILFSLANYEMHMNQRRKYEAILDRYCPTKWWMPPREAPWVYDLRIPGLTWIKQCEVVIALNKAGIAARFAFKPMSMQEEYQDCRKVGGDEARKASVEVIYLPLTPGLVTEASARQAFEIIKSVVQ